MNNWKEKVKAAGFKEHRLWVHPNDYPVISRLVLARQKFRVGDSPEGSVGELEQLLELSDELSKRIRRLVEGGALEELPRDNVVPYQQPAHTTGYQPEV